MEDEDELLSHQDRKAKEVYIHDEYIHSKKNFHNGIALIEVDEPFVLAPHIDTICLPPPNENFDGKWCAATGWGTLKFGKKERGQSLMKEVWLEVLNHSHCENLLTKTKLGEYFILNQESFICAGGESDKDMCTVSFKPFKQIIF